MEPPDPSNPISRGLQRVLDSGFDRAELDEEGYIRVRCSQCEALVINKVPCHELGCPNMKRKEEC